MGRGSQQLFFSKKTYKWPTGTWKVNTLGKCKSKPQWYMSSHLLEWLFSKRQEISVGENVEKRQPLCTVRENANWCSHCGKQYRGSFKKLKTELPYDPAIPLLGIYLKETKLLLQKDTCTPIITATLFVITKTRKQLVHW